MQRTPQNTLLLLFSSSSGARIEEDEMEWVVWRIAELIKETCIFTTRCFSKTSKDLAKIRNDCYFEAEANKCNSSLL